MVNKQVVEVVNPFIKVMQSKVPEYKGICSLLSIKRPYSSKYSKDTFHQFIRYFINSKCLKISMKEYENLISNKYMSETRSKKCDQSIKVLLDSTHLTFPAIMISLGYISKLKKNTVTSSLLHHQNNSEVKILTLALMASMKAHYDNVYSNKSWSTVSGIPLKELNVLESNFLHDINFDLYIDEKIFFNYLDIVENSLDEYYNAIKTEKVQNNTENFENSNIPAKTIKPSRSFKNSVNITPAHSPQSNDEFKDQKEKINDSLYNKSFDYLNVPENNYKGRKSTPISPSDNTNSESYKSTISTPSLYSNESSFSSDISEINSPQYKDDSKEIRKSKIISYPNNNDNIIQSKINEESRSSTIKPKPTKYYSSVPSFLKKYQQKVENDEYIKYLNELDMNAKEKPKKENKTLNRIIEQRNTRSSPESKNENIFISNTSKNESNQRYIPKRTSSTNLNSQLKNCLNNNTYYNDQIINETSSSSIKPSKSLSLAYQNNKSNQQTVDPSSQLFRHKTISLTYSKSSNYPQGQYAIPVYQQHVTYKNQTPVQPIYPYYIPQNTSQIGVIYDTNIIQQPIPIPPNSTLIQAQPAIPSNPIPSPISPHSIKGIKVHHQESFHSNYSTPSPYPGSIIATPVNSSIYYTSDTNLTTPVHIISPPIKPLPNYPYKDHTDNNIRNNHSKMKEKSFDNNNYEHLSKSFTSINDNSSYDSLYYQDIIDNNINNNEGESGTSTDIAKRSNTIGRSQNIKNELKSKGNTSSHSHTHGKPTNNNINGYENSVAHSNSYSYESSIMHSNSYSYESSIYHKMNPNLSFSFDNSLRKSNDNYKTNSYDNSSLIVDFSSACISPTYGPIDKNNYYEPSLNYSYVNNSYPIINNIYKSNSYSIASSSSSILNDNGSYYYNKGQSNNSSFYKKKSNNNKYPTSYQYLNDSDKSKAYYRSKSFNNKSYNNNSNKGPNRSRSYSNSFRYKTNTIKHSNSNGFNNAMKESKSKLYNQTTNGTENNSYSNSYSYSYYNKNSNDTKYINKKNDIDEEKENETKNSSININIKFENSKNDEIIEKEESINLSKTMVDESNNDDNYNSYENGKEILDSKVIDISDNESDGCESSSLSNKDEVDTIISKYNPDIFKKMFDFEARRYSSISTYHLDNFDKDSQNILSKSNRYRYSDCNFETIDYETSRHIENIKNDLMENNTKFNDTIVSINSNMTDADFISERDSLKNTEDVDVNDTSYISSIIESNDDTNINLYINDEEIQINDSFISSNIDDDFYDLESEIHHKNNNNNNNKDLVNTSFSSITSNSESVDSKNDNNKMYDKTYSSKHSSHSKIKITLKKALRSNSTPIHSNSTDEDINEDINEDRYKNLPESKPMEKITNNHNNDDNNNNNNERQEPKIIKNHQSKKSGIKKTMSLILESGSKIFTKRQNQNQNQNQNQIQSKGNNIVYYNSKELPPIPMNEKDILEAAKTELKINKKKHHSNATIGSHLLLKLDREPENFSSFSNNTLNCIEPASNISK